MPVKFSYILIFMAIFLGVNAPEFSFAIQPAEVLVVVNSRMPGARSLADYYMERRRIPKENLLATSLTKGEVMRRVEYERGLLQPVKNKLVALKNGKKNIYAIVLIHGVPLKVLPPAPDRTTRDTLISLRRTRKAMQRQQNGDEEAKQSLAELNRRIAALAGTDKRASVDSELMLAGAGPYELSGWIENPYFPGFRGKKTAVGKKDVLIVARLDGPDARTVRRIIDDTLTTEQHGLQGKAYFDARWPRATGDNLRGYAQWDLSLHRAADRVGRRMTVVLDDRQALFAPGAAPDAALYCGWYSLARYVDSFSWNRGAVGYHIASAECATLRKTDSQVWCLQMLKRGVAATIGPVYEPYVQGFPLPELFFGALSEGYMDLGESYLIALPYISWQMVLVGDPLYRPFTPLATGVRRTFTSETVLSSSSDESSQDFSVPPQADSADSAAGFSQGRSSAPDR